MSIFEQIFYTKNYSSFDEWLSIIGNDDEVVYPRFRIPYDEWLEDYIAAIQDKSVEEVKDLLRYLLIPMNRGIDLDNYNTYLAEKNSNKPEFVDIANIKYQNNESIRRIENGQYAWEGITWALELLMSSPYKAMKVLGCYVLAQANLPDDRITGISQCIDIIMAKFIYPEHPLEKILKLKPVEFEWLIEILYKAMGYDTIWTPSTRDGGKDIIATIKRTDCLERVYIECKRYNTTKLDRNTVEAFCNKVIKEEINRGVIFCTGYVNENIKKIDQRIQIWSYKEIDVLLNAHLGNVWSENLDILIDNQRRKYKDNVKKR